MLRMLSVATLASLALAAGLAFVPGAEAPAVAQPMRAGACPLRLGDQQSLECHCSAQATSRGDIYGSNFYTDDSAVCRAALHAGVIGEDGGRVSVYAARGQSSYPTVERNGVTSTGYGNWPRSIAFRLDGRRARRSEIHSCPANSMSMSPGESLTCSCEPGSTEAGTVWGSGPYTSDSGVCRAALHAGVIDAGGGTLRLRALPGRSSYAASRRNGVATRGWGANGGSFDFDD
jgi:hypothetical protein